MKTTDFAEYLSTFLTMYLPGQRGLSSNTIMSYRDTFKQVLQYAESCGIRPEKLTLSKFNADFIEAFLNWLEKERGCSRSTRNQRLAAVRSFARYVHSKRPEYLFESQKITGIRSKKKPEPLLPFLSPELIGAILAQPDMTTVFGRRDAVLLSLLYDSAARVQELCDLRVRDVRLQEPYTVTLTGKGDKTRSVPIMRDTAALLIKYASEHKMSADRYDYPFFHNHQHGKLTRAGVTYILKKHCNSAREQFPQIPEKMSPHVFGRHSKAMHMLQAGVNLVYIRDFLGHAHLSTTEIYLRTDIESKRAAIEKAAIKMSPDLPDWTKDKTLMAVLTTLCVVER